MITTRYARVSDSNIFQSSRDFYPTEFCQNQKGSYTQTALKKKRTAHTNSVRKLTFDMNNSFKKAILKNAARRPKKHKKKKKEPIKERDGEGRSLIERTNQRENETNFKAKERTRAVL